MVQIRLCRHAENDRTYGRRTGHRGGIDLGCLVDSPVVHWSSRNTFLGCDLGPFLNKSAKEGCSTLEASIRLGLKFYIGECRSVLGRHSGAVEDS